MHSHRHSHCHDSLPSPITMSRRIAAILSILGYTTANKHLSLWPVDPSSKDAQCPAFRAVDDRVRGGSSQSHLTVSASGQTASFNGTLDTTTLGGAGFASQVTLDGPTWDLSSFDGLELIVGKELLNGSEEKGQKYVLLVKDTLEGDRGDGREKSGVSWEYVFHAQAGQAIKARWSKFKPTYRGREIDVPKGGLKTGEIKRIGFMMRSFFDAQSGSFNLPIRSLAAFKKVEKLDELEKHTTRHSTSSSATRVASHAPDYPEISKEECATIEREIEDITRANKAAQQKNREERYLDRAPTPDFRDKKEADAWEKEQKQYRKDKEEASHRAAEAEREKERNARTGIGALTGEMRDRGEGGQPGWRGYFNWIGRGCF